MRARKITRPPRSLAARSKGALVLSTAIGASFALIAAGCAAGGKSPAVASIGTANSTTTRAPASEATAQNYGDAMAYSECMRGHHLPDFPDPDSQGRLLVNIHQGSDLMPSSSQYQSANRACRHLLPNGGEQTPAQGRQELAQLLKYAHCMRSHGLPNFPDPVFIDGHAALTFQRGGDTGQSSPQFQKAQQACRSLSPGG
jgi:hypothetical protein